MKISGKPSPSISPTAAPLASMPVPSKAANWCPGVTFRTGDIPDCFGGTSINRVLSLASASCLANGFFEMLPDILLGGLDEADSCFLVHDTSTVRVISVASRPHFVEVDPIDFIGLKFTGGRWQILNDFLPISGGA